METPMRLMLLSIIALLAFNNAAHETITPVQQVQRAELVVLGKLSDRKELNAEYAAATLTFKEVLKGDKALKTVKVRFLAKPGNTATWTYEGTEEGLWFLIPAGEGMYETFHANGLIRTTFTEIEAQKQVNEYIAEVREIIKQTPKTVK